MTSLAEGGPQARSRGRLFWAALALSLTLNIFFVGGLVWSKIAIPPVPTPAERFAQVATELKLSPDQHDAFQRFMLEVRQHGRHLRENNHPLIDRVWGELAKPQPDQAFIASLIDQATENRHAYQKEMSTVLIQFLATLSQDQRNQFVQLTQKPQDQMAQRLRRLIIP